MDRDDFESLHERRDGQHYGIQTIEVGCFQSVFPCDLAEYSQLHSTRMDAYRYLKPFVAQAKARG